MSNDKNPLADLGLIGADMFIRTIDTRGSFTRKITGPLLIIPGNTMMEILFYWKRMNRFAPVHGTKVYGTCLLMLCLLAGCTRYVECPAFPDSKLSWMPYQPDEIIKFSNGTDTIEIIVSDTSKSASSTLEKGCSCECGGTAEFRTRENPQVNLMIKGYAHGDINAVDYEYSFIKYLDPYNGYASTYLFFFHDDDAKDAINGIEINSVIYNNVIKIEHDTIDNGNTNWKKPEIWRALIADSIGLIQFDDSYTKESWKLVK